MIALSSMPHVAEKIKMFHALSPATTLKNSQSPITKLLFLPDAVLKVFDVQCDGSSKDEDFNYLIIVSL